MPKGKKYMKLNHLGSINGKSHACLAKYYNTRFEPKLDSSHFGEISASILKNKKILFQSLFWKKFPSKNCEISFKFPLRNLIKLR